MRAEAVKGHLDSILLASLEAQPLHGYAIMVAVRAGSRASFDLPTGRCIPPCIGSSAPGLSEANGRPCRAAGVGPMS